MKAIGYIFKKELKPGDRIILKKISKVPVTVDISGSIDIVESDGYVLRTDLGNIMVLPKQISYKRL